MTEPPQPGTAAPLRCFVWAAILALFLDQVTKVLVYGLVPKGEVVKLLGDALRVWHVHNPQGVFGLSYGPRALYLLLPLLGSVLVVWFGIRARACWPATAYGMILGGAIGNVVDRMRFGHVIDFIDVGWRNWHWHTFNVADACVVGGVVMLLARELFRRRRAAPGPAGPAAAREDC
ncbi:signal peptidase II [candidate division WOR-3 bacterium]|nr:signal peptidase II [candidate division WOR-3 bacterium]